LVGKLLGLTRLTVFLRLPSLLFFRIVFQGPTDSDEENLKSRPFVQPLRHFSFSFGGLSFHQDYLANEGTGAVVWDSEVVISRFLDIVGESGALRGKQVIELGAGLAMACFVAAAHGATTVATDIDANMHAIFNKNVNLNKATFEKRDPAILALLELRMLYWGHHHFSQLEPIFQSLSVRSEGEAKPAMIIVVSDCLFEADPLDILLETIERIALQAKREGGRVAILSCFETRAKAKEAQFIEGLRKLPLLLTEVVLCGDRHLQLTASELGSVFKTCSDGDGDGDGATDTERHHFSQITSSPSSKQLSDFEAMCEVNDQVVFSMFFSCSDMFTPNTRGLDQGPIMIYKGEGDNEDNSARVAPLHHNTPGR
jgi:predicted nicotinamide N-methyase